MCSSTCHPRSATLRDQALRIRKFWALGQMPYEVEPNGPDAATMQRVERGIRDIAFHHRHAAPALWVGGDSVQHGGIVVAMAAGLHQHYPFDAQDTRCTRVSAAIGASGV
jgi:hypothetical protein